MCVSRRRDRRSTSSEMTQAYGEAWYWDKRYSNDAGTFEWYQNYDALSPIFHLYIPPQSHRQILVVGCGSSAFSEGLINDDYDNVVNIDISSVVIEAMQKKYSDIPQLKYIEMDVRDMSSFQSCSMDAVVDKGTLDSLLVSELRSVFDFSRKSLEICVELIKVFPLQDEPNRASCGHNSRQNAAKMLKEVGRVLKKEGIYILITYGAPIYRLRLLRDSCSWTTINLHVIAEKFPSGENSEHEKRELTNPIPLDGDGNPVEAVLGKNSEVHYIYVCIKG